MVWQAGVQGGRRLSRKRREAVWDGDKGKDECSQFLELSRLVFGGRGQGGMLEEGTRDSRGGKLESAMQTGTISPVIFLFILESRARRKLRKLHYL